MKENKRRNDPVLSYLYSLNNFGIVSLFSYPFLVVFLSVSNACVFMYVYQAFVETLRLWHMDEDPHK